MTTVETYLLDGCGRCERYQSPSCSVHLWQDELVELRRMALEAGLEEQIKWSCPCYSMENKNILMVAAFREYAAIAFFKGVLIKDPADRLVSPGKNSRSSRHLRYTNVIEIRKDKSLITDFIGQAIAIESAGLKIPKRGDLELPMELVEAFAADTRFEDAFGELTPGRQSGYLIYFSGAKKSETRHARIAKWKPTILAGKGMHDDYREKSRKL